MGNLTDVVFCSQVRSHVGDVGNERADRLAALGSRSAFVAAFVPATATDLFSPFGRCAWWPELLRFLSGEDGVGRGAIVESAGRPGFGSVGDSRLTS